MALQLTELKDKPLIVTEFFFRLFIGITFFTAGALKVGDIAAFQQDILNYRLVPHLFAGLSAIFLPWFEMVCAVALIFRRLYLGALTALTVLMTLFTFGYLQATARGIDISCGCFGKASEGQPPEVIITRDIILLSSLAFLWWLNHKNQQRPTANPAS